MNEYLKEIFVDLKDTSELMLDLAYASLIFNQKEIAEVVIELEKYMNKIYNKFLENAIDSIVKGTVSREDIIAMIKISGAMEDIGDGARGIVDGVVRGIKYHPIIKKSIMESDIIPIKGIVEENSFLSGKSLSQVALGTNTGVELLAIKRQNEWLFGPEGNTVILPGDILIGKGPDDSKKEFLELTINAGNS